MRLNRLVGLAVALLANAVVFPLAASSQITTTLLPTKASGATLRIKAPPDASSAELTFSLDEIPPNAEITSATLRIVGKKKISETPQFGKVFVDAFKKEPIGQWTATKFDDQSPTAFHITSGAMRDAARSSVDNAKILTFKLTSESNLSAREYYGLPANSNDFPSAYKPRLVIEYKLPATTQNLWDPETATRTSNKLFVSVSKTAYWVAPVDPRISILCNPVFYRQDMYLFGKWNSEGSNPSEQDLFEFTSGGTFTGLHLHPQRYRKLVQDVPDGPHALISNDGRVYVLGKGSIVLYDANHFDKPAGRPMSPSDWDIKAQGKVTVDGLKVVDPPSLGADGSLYFVRSGFGYVYGMNPELQELWRYPAQDGAGAEKISPITLSPEAQHAYFLTRRGKENKFVTIDATDGSATVIPLDEKFTDFRRPLVAKRPKQDYVIVSAYSENDGTLDLYSGGNRLWHYSGAVSQPVMTADGETIFVVQKGHFRKYATASGASSCVSKEETAATSNLVIDGDQNVFFWNNGRFMVFRGTDCALLFNQQLSGLPENLDLMFSPNGTLFARIKANNTLKAIRPH